jgi:phage terminase large subunit
LSPPRIEIPEAFAGLFQPARHKAFYGGRGSAKSHSFAAALVVKAISSQVRVLCLREIQKSIKESSKLLIEDKIRGAGLESRFEILDTEIRERFTGSRFTFAGLRTNPDALKSSEGVDIAAVWEAAPVSQRSIDLLIPTIRKDGSELWWEWNPEHDHDPVDRLFRGPAGPPPNSIVRRVDWRDNPWFPETLRAERDHLYATDPDKAEHVWGGEYVRAVEGAYFAQQLREARLDGRITWLRADPLIQRRAFWDIGIRDATAIWVAQFVGGEIRVIDYIEGVGQPLAYYVEELRARGHRSALCVLPHDGVTENNITALRYEDHVRAAGFETTVIKNQGKGAAMMRVEAARRLFPRIWIDEDKCAAGLKALAAYHERWDDKRNAGMGPEHDWASHGADAFGLMCVAYEEPRKHIEKLAMPSYGVV